MLQESAERMLFLVPPRLYGRFLLELELPVTPSLYYSVFLLTRRSVVPSCLVLQLKPVLKF
jgi:hypothetical protein